MKKLLMLVFMCSSFIFLSAQETVTVEGTVTDENGEALPGVTILVKGTQSGTVTNYEGVYSINVDPSATLVFSFVGYTNQEVEVGDRRVIDVTLTPQAYDVEEVVVVGYGTSEVKDLTAPVATVKSDEISKQPVSNVGQALQGKVAGVQVSSNGVPGTSPTFRIRGLGTVNSNADPLFIVDGMIVDDISFVNPNDIESVTVLKDASSAAIYGVRAANGVVLITTQKGSIQKPKVSYKGHVGVQTVSNLLPLLGTEEYITMINEKLYASYLRDTVNMTYQPFDLNEYPDETDWFEEVLRPARMQSHELSVSGGNEVSTYHLSLGYTNQEGLVKKNNYQRLNLRARQDISVNDAIKFGYNMALVGWDQDNAPNVLMNAYKAPPAFEPKENDTTFTNPVALGFGNFGNPAASIEYHNSITQGAKTLTNLYTEIKPIPELKIKSSFIVDGQYQRTRNYTPEYYVSTIQFDTLSPLSKSRNTDLNYTWDNTATFEKNFNDHRVKAMVGFSAYQYRSHYLSASAYGVPNFSEATLYLFQGEDGSSTATDNGGLVRENSYFGRLFYSFRDRYLLTATLRRDASSNFPAENRWGTFPSLGLGWVISDEAFMLNVAPVDFLKLRASFGVLGNSDISQNAYTQTVNTYGGYSVVYGPYGSTNISQGGSITSIVEPLLLWEVIREFNVGLDGILLDRRLNAELDYYYRVTQNAIFPVPVIGTSGTSGGSFLDNNADVLNTGLELTLNWQDKIGEFGYSIGGNATTIRNEILKLAEGTLPFYDGGVYNGNLATYNQEGHPIGEFYVLEVDGVFQNFEEVNNYRSSDNTVIMPNAVPGDLRFKDQNDDGSIDNADRISYGSYTPKLMYSLNLGVNYRNFDFSVDFQGVAGNKIYNAKRANRFGNESYDHDFYENRWYGEGTSSTYPSADVAGGMNAFPSTFFVESGAYFRIQNIQLGYTLPSRITDRVNVEQLRIYVTAQNPYSYFTYNGFSPEIPGGSPTTQGIDYGVYPLSTTTSFGVNLKF